jgi:hypothetical protein
VNSCDAVFLAESVTCKVNFADVPLAVDAGIPVIFPEESKLNPSGKLLSLGLLHV